MNKKVGLAPGTLKYTGSSPKERIKLSLIVYNEQTLEQHTFYDWSELEKHLKLYNDSYIKWINIDGINHVQLIEKVGEFFDVHPLSLEDILHVDQRAKYEEFDHYVIGIFKAFYYESTEHRLISEQLSMVLSGNTTIITFQENIAIDPFDVVRKRLSNPKGKSRRSQADYLFYALLDATVDYYFACIERLGDRIEELENELIKDKDPVVSQTNIYKIYRLKRDIIQIRKMIWPMRDMINSILHSEEDIFSDNTKFYMRDVYDHIVRIIDTVETHRDLIAGLMDFYLTMNANKMNEVMKFLTIISTIFIPVTFIAGVYGMNFENMPELHYKGGYFFIIGLMAVTVLALFLYFKKKKWI